MVSYSQLCPTFPLPLLALNMSRLLSNGIYLHTMEFYLKCFSLKYYLLAFILQKIEKLLQILFATEIQKNILPHS